ncbi:uncharacterized protein CDV56_104838 [Aspergillus thermomutatus]|uniref:Vacuolar calcium ion transporter n=1 Tax=Aspergillus thermomutatus TaxID=41047 RepID=A0A397GMQ4_ASPTH|nr:uncharacterized protein CDV56_104838 [Aspergillus thermomutatus]RHZ51797.1 hypothetical protein CDV56_104838 [Aspergillus thermomutatus]
MASMDRSDDSETRRSPAGAYEGANAVLSLATPLLWVFPPLGIIAGLFHWEPWLVLVLNIIAIIPLSALVSSSSDALSGYLGQLGGGLVNATCGNAVELTCFQTSVLGLSHGEIDFAQSVMIGSILSDVLLILGACLVSASYDKDVRCFNPTVVQSLSSLMMITVVTIILPTALYSTSPSTNLDDRILSFSCSTAAILLALYFGYLYFHLSTHRHLFESKDDGDKPNNTEEPPSAAPGHLASTLKMTSATLATVFCSYLVFASIDGTVETTGITKTFVGAVLIPLASNSPEGSAVIMAVRGGDADSAVGVIVDSVLQIGLLLIPVLVILGWFLNQPMSLDFENWHTAILFLSALVVDQLLQDGRYTYTQGIVLIALYAILVSTIYEFGG